VLNTPTVIASIKKQISTHCAKHTTATALLTLGVDMATISKILGHTNIRTTAIYAKVVPTEKIKV
jgi:site-specific recombinase XerD